MGPNVGDFVPPVAAPNVGDFVPPVAAPNVGDLVPSVAAHNVGDLVPPVGSERRSLLDEPRFPDDDLSSFGSSLHPDFPYKLLAIDLDGTLLGRDGVPHTADRAAVARLRAAGVPTTICTGRLYSGSRDIARLMGIEGPIACVDGSQIVDTRSDEEVFVRSIGAETAVIVRDLLATHGTASFLFAQDLIVHDALGEPFAHYVRTWSPKIEVVERVADHPHWEHERGVMAVVALGTTETILAVVGAMRADLAETMLVIDFPVARLSGMHALVARAAGATKGTALSWLAAHHGCTLAEIVAVGDWVNDVPMFQAAGRSFVMGQAPEHVKRSASDRLLADLHSGGGIAEAIREAWGIL